MKQELQHTGVSAPGALRRRPQWWAGAVWQSGRRPTSKLPLNSHRPPLACISGGWHSGSTLLRNDRPFLWTTRSVFFFWLVSTLVWFHSECTLHGPACDKALSHHPQFNKEAWMDEAHISASLWALKDVSVTKKRETKSSSTPIYSRRGWKFDCGGSMREKFEAKAS